MPFRSTAVRPQCKETHASLKELAVKMHLLEAEQPDLFLKGNFKKRSDLHVVFVELGIYNIFYHTHAHMLLGCNTVKSHRERWRSRLEGWKGEAGTSDAVDRQRVERIEWARRMQGETGSVIFGWEQ
eukprot:765288-Hanusia_phi.AAC.1